VTAQVHIQLEVVEPKPPPELVRDVDGEPGLANPSHSGDHRHSHRRRTVVRRQRLAQLGLPAGELLDIHRQLRPRDHDVGSGWRITVELARDDVGVHVARRVVIRLLPPVEPQVLGCLCHQRAATTRPRVTAPT